MAHSKNLPTDVPKLSLDSVDVSIPQSVLQRISTITGVSTHHLSSFTLKSNSEFDVMRDAILSYVEEFSKLRDDATPLLAEARFRFDDNSDSDDDKFSDSDFFFGDDEDIDDADPERKKTYLDAVKKFVSSQAKGYGRKASFSLGRTETVVPWPPPPELSARTLATKDLNKMALKDKNARKKYIVIGDFKENNAHLDDDDELTNGESSISSRTGCDNEQNILIYVAQYDFGEPVSVDDEIKVLQRLSVVSTAPTSMLRKFAQEVMTWNREKNPCLLPGRRFQKTFWLSRYVLKDDGEGYWEEQQERRSRSADSVILAKGQMTAILDDVSHFLSKETKKWYKTNCLPQRRSYLFYGPPGTGKTSSVKVIASAFGRQCCFLNMANDKFSNQTLADALETLPSGPLLIIEDVDALFTNRKSDLKSLTFSGLLNALDGMLSMDGTITILTTNHVDRLDEALLRAGRVDRRFYFGPPDQDCIRRMFLKFYPDADSSVADQFTKQVWEWPDKMTARSMATLQQLFIMKRGSSAGECADSVKEFFNTYFPDGEDIRKKLIDEATGNEDSMSRNEEDDY